MRKLSNQEIGKIGLYEFQGYIGAMTSPTFGGWKGTDSLLDSLSIKDMGRPKILEVGCSTGYITRHVAQKFDCDIVGVDISEILLEIARDESDKLSLNNISFKRANVEDLPFPDDSFDIVYGEAITALVKDPLKVLGEYKRVLKKGGKVATLDLFMRESLTDELKEEIDEIMSNALGANVKIRGIKEWEIIFKESGFTKVVLNQYYEDLFVRGYSLSEKLNITSKLIYHMSVNRGLRQTMLPMLKFAKKFQSALKGGNFGYFIFIGEK